MKKAGLFLALAVVVAVSLPGVGWAGYCLNSDIYCNDYFLSIKPAEGGVYEAHGYEYGCGYKNRLVSGSVLVVGGVANIGLSGVSAFNFDVGQVSGVGVPINMSSNTGTGNFLYLYLNGGVVSGHGGSSSFTLGGCGFPGASAASVDPDASE